MEQWFLCALLERTVPPIVTVPPIGPNFHCTYTPLLSGGFCKYPTLTLLKDDSIFMLVNSLSELGLPKTLHVNDIVM